MKYNASSVIAKENKNNNLSDSNLIVIFDLVSIHKT